MASTKISGLAAVASFLGTHEFGVNEGGTSKKVTGTQIMAKLAQGTLGYAQVTANQSGINAAVDLTSLSVAVTVAAGSRRIKITGFCFGVISTVANDVGSFRIMEGATQICSAQTPALPTGNGPFITVQAILVPTAGAHTYKLQAARVAGTGTLTFAADATDPMFILVEDIGT